MTLSADDARTVADYAAALRSLADLISIDGNTPSPDIRQVIGGILRPSATSLPPVQQVYADLCRDPDSPANYTRVCADPEAQHLRVTLNKSLGLLGRIMAMGNPRARGLSVDEYQAAPAKLRASADIIEEQNGAPGTISQEIPAEPLTGRGDPKTPPAADSGKRPAYDRDHLFLAWYETEGSDTYHSHAKIRDRWNAIPISDRKRDYPTAPNKVEREAVIKCIERAKKDRGT